MLDNLNGYAIKFIASGSKNLIHVLGNRSLSFIARVLQTTC